MTEPVSRADIEATIRLLRGTCVPLGEPGRRVADWLATLPSLEGCRVVAVLADSRAESYNERLARYSATVSEEWTVDLIKWRDEWLAIAAFLRPVTT